MLALVVGHPATVEPAVALGQRPGREPLQPCSLHAADDVAVAVDQHRRQVGVLGALGQQQRPARRRIDQHLAEKAHVLERRPQVVGQIGREMRRAARLLALARHRHEAREIGQEDPAVEVAGGTFEDGLTLHRGGLAGSSGTVVHL